MNKLSTKGRINFGDQLDTNCVLCNSGNESINHLFFNCSFSAWIWRSILWRVGFRRKPKKSLIDEIAWLKEKCNGHGQCSTAATYKIWRERNLRIFENKSSHKSQILNELLSEVKLQLNGLQLSDDPNPQNLSAARLFNYKLWPKEISQNFCVWEPPKIDEIKVNVDASLVEAGGSIGGLLRQNLGECIAMFSINSDPEPIFALELTAIQQGMDLAIAHNFRKVWIESDSKFAVDIINGRSEIPWTQLEKIYHIHTAMNSFLAIRVTHQTKQQTCYPSVNSDPKGSISSPPRLRLNRTRSC
ncbi:uncharacterized protein LOC143853891 [Tasmannia lanceolata]|uniref:uncharacterized protein LOC143853891 n=1 Tax=Tasmannia lanceolata TaxID=3420 RepID=UPI004063A6CF